MNAIARELVGCYHCGLPLPEGPRWHARIQGVEQDMCCPGCAAAAQAIVDAGCGDYYATRTGFGTRIETPDAPALALFDADGNPGEGSFTVEGIRCAACVWLIERRIEAVPGVREARLNVTARRLQVTWEPQRCTVSAILRALHAIGYTGYPYDARRHGEQLARERRTLFRQLFVAGLSMMQVMMYAVPVYLADDGTMDADMTALMGWASMLLTLPAVLYSARPFFAGAWRDLRRGLPGMDVPVALGIGAAFIGSTAALLHGGSDLYFDSVTMFVFLLLASRYLELDARRRAAGALEALQDGLPASAQRLPRWPERTPELVLAAALRPGDLVLVAPGQAAPADGAIVEGETEVDLALLTGESRTKRMGPGDNLPGGAVNVAQPVVLRVGAAARDSTLALLVRLAGKAGQGKPAIALRADRVAAWSVAALLVLTAIVFAGWQLVDPARAWPAAIAVLVVTCPCALSLATPTALAAATDSLLRRGVLAISAHTLETFERATHVVFDKTGTLTLGRPRLVATRVYGAPDAAWALRIAAGLEAGNAHPLAQALRAAAPPAACAEDVSYVLGRGIEGSVGGVRYRLGSACFVAQVAGPAPLEDGAHEPPGEASIVWLGCAGNWLACFEIADALRPEAAEVVRRLEAAGKTVVLLSGDGPQASAAVAARVGIRTAAGGQLPADKLDFVRRLQAGGSVVAMVGDGSNDAAVLRGADVSFAMGSGAPLAQLHADGVLLGDSLAPLLDTAETARRSLCVIRQNLAWASAYNLLAIPAAAAGLLNPWLSSIGMAASSAIVVLNALRLRK